MRVTALLVEDHEPTRLVIERLLASEGVRTESVANGREALGYLKLQTPDLVVSDVVMPYVDGLTLLSVLRQDPRTSELPVMLVSALDSDEVRAQCRAASAVLVPKPFRQADLVTALRRLLPRRRPSARAEGAAGSPTP